MSVYYGNKGWATQNYWAENSSKTKGQAEYLDPALLTMNVVMGSGGFCISENKKYQFSKPKERNVVLVGGADVDARWRGEGNRQSGSVAEGSR